MTDLFLVFVNWMWMFWKKLSLLRYYKIRWWIYKFILILRVDFWLNDLGSCSLQVHIHPSGKCSGHLQCLSISRTREEFPGWQTEWRFFILYCLKWAHLDRTLVGDIFMKITQLRYFSQDWKLFKCIAD